VGIRDRYTRKKESERNAGRPTGMEERPRPPRGAARILDLVVEKPVVRGGIRGVEVAVCLQAHELSRARIVIEATLHEQGKGPLRSRDPRYADSQGALNAFEVFTPERDEPVEVERRFFFPFAAIEVEREGALRCFARARALEQDRGELAAGEVAFTLEAG
jgi:hypothetical protein